MSVNKEPLQVSSSSVHCTSSNLNLPNETVFYGVYVPREEDDNLVSNNSLHVYTNKLEALKVIKLYKKGRFKSFKNQREAEEYALNGFEHINSINTASPVVQARVNTEEKSNVFKGPKPQDFIWFRKVIESGDLEAVRKIVWENPRYLVSNGDTPAILQEGCRYNALHVAVKAASTEEMCELILNTVADTKFVQLLYGEEESKNYLDRAQILLDLYLNTPDKGLNETPLHLAVKFGLKNVVRVLVSYPQCVKTLPNKYQQTPTDIICSRRYQEDETLKKEILALLEEQFYVPVLRSEDNTLQPAIGEPFSPTSPLSLNEDPISPRMEVRAFAGPMTRNQAVEFRRKWKTPPRLCSTPNRKRDNTLDDSFSIIADSPRRNSALRLQDTEKGLECVGRDLATECCVSWKEYWPFLNDFADLRSLEGLLKLEKFLERRFKDSSISYIKAQENKMNSEIKKEPEMDILDEINILCDRLEACILDVEKNYCTTEDNLDDADFFTPPSSPNSTCSSSDDEMFIAEEGLATFIEGQANNFNGEKFINVLYFFLYFRHTSSKLDFAVYNAISSTDINPITYPYIYRWQHEMQLTMQRELLKFNTFDVVRRKLLMTPEKSCIPRR